MKRMLGFVWLLAALVVLPAAAEVKVTPLFGDNMVVQREEPIAVWGTADAGEVVTVSIGTSQAAATADQQGKWSLSLPELKAGGPHELSIRGKSNSLTFKNVLVGEVWICSGQSNMEWPVKMSNDADKEIAEAKYPNIRLFTVKKTVAGKPQSNLEGSWSECSPESIPTFSAVGYFFGRELHKELDVPIGLINSSWGGTPAEAWTEVSFLEKDPMLVPILERWKKNIDGLIGLLNDYGGQLLSWRASSNLAEAAGNPIPDPPKFPDDPRRSPHRASGLYNGMIAPLVPYSVRGAIWYQGESNAGRAYQYRTLFPAMIQSWRAAFKQEDLSFHFVQLANFTEVLPEPAESDWAELREAQTMTLALPKTGMAVIIDIGEAKDIHPRNKQDVGKRLALNALATDYGKKVPYSGPLYEKMEVKGAQAVLSFKHVDGGLVAKGEGGLKGFAIAGEDKQFVWADAKIEGNKVVVSSEKVEKPVAVRYAWANNPVCNLYNGAGLPASPFRTDDWPGKTYEAR